MKLTLVLPEDIDLHRVLRALPCGPDAPCEEIDNCGECAKLVYQIKIEEE